MLASFIGFLHENNLIDFESVIDDTDGGFETRFRIQKLVYLSSHFGLNHGYHYNIYRYGPYSRSLADDYYTIGENPQDFEAEFNEPLPANFDYESFLRAVNDKDNNWLEIATTLLDQKPRFANDGDLINHVEIIKCDYSHEYIGTVLRDLQRINLAS